MSDLIVYGFPASANAHRVGLLLALLGISYEERTVNLAAGEQRDPAFLAINPRGQIPVLKHGGDIIIESNAILIYLIERFGRERQAEFWPAEPLDRAKVAAWLFYCANDLQNGIGLTRVERVFGRAAGGDFSVGRAKRSLEVVERHLQDRDYLELDRVTLADIAAYPFLKVVPDAGLADELGAATQQWIERLERLPNFLPMPLLAK